MKRPDYYRPGTSVRVVLRDDPFTGRFGTVASTRNDAGDMVHRVEFGGGEWATYLAPELRSRDGRGDA